MRTHYCCVVVVIAIGAACAGCPSGARACSSNSDCKAGEVCVVADGAGTCGTPTVDDRHDAGSPDDDAGPGPEDAGPDAGVLDDAGFADDAGPADAGTEPEDAGPHDYALTASPAVGASTSANGAKKLRARVRAAEVAAPMAGGPYELASPRR